MILEEILSSTFPDEDNTARRQLFFDLKQAYNEQGKAAADQIPDIFAAYMTLAIERFVRKAIVKVALPDDAAESLTTALSNCFGNSCEAITEIRQEDAGEFIGSIEKESVIVAPAPAALEAVVNALRVYTGVQPEMVYAEDPRERQPPHGEGSNLDGETLESTTEVIEALKNGINFV